MKISGQSTLEFVFAMVAVLCLMYGMIQVFRWVGMDLAQRRYAQDASFSQAVVKGSMDELKKDSHHPARLNAFPKVGLKD